jgi:Flp pilus assembly pilin Flp
MREERGQAAVEFVLILPFVALIIWAMLYAGIALVHFNNVTQIASDGARKAAVGFDQSAQQFAADIENRAIGDPGDITVGVDRINGGTAIGDPVRVCVTESFTVSFPLLGSKTISIRSRAVMRSEAPAERIKTSGTCTT